MHGIISFDHDKDQKLRRSRYIDTDSFLLSFFMNICYCIKHKVFNLELKRKYESMPKGGIR